MTVSVEDIDRWSGGDVREVFHATRSRAEAAFEAANGIAQLPAFGSWGGDASEAAQTAIGKTRSDLDAHGNEALAVAQAASKAADDVEEVKSNLAALRSDAEHMGMAIDPIGNTIVPGPGAAGADPMETMLKQMQLQTRLDAILAAAARVDQELATAINMATGATPIADTPHDNRPEVRDALSKPLPEDPQQFAGLWRELTAEEKDWLYRQDHTVGNHPGMPFVDKNHYNQLHLPELRASAQARVDQLAAAHPGWVAGQVPNPKGNVQTYRQWQDWKKDWQAANHTLDGYTSVDSTLHAKDGIPRLLGFIDDQGHAAVSIGNPDTASHTATLVPGTGQDLAAFGGANDKSMKMYDAAIQADKSLRGDLAVTTWMGYDRPMDVFEAGSTDPARNGAGALDTFLSGAQASHQGPPSLDTVVGHSYGSTLVGAAGSDGHHLPAENIIGVGSPGMLVDRASDLSLDPGGQVYAARAQHDMIQAAVGTVLGPDPTWNGFGATELQASPGPTMGPPVLEIPSITAHSSYWDIGNPALKDMGAIIAGKPPPFTVPPN